MTKILTKFKEKPSYLALTCAFLFLAALARFLVLDNKPIHFDESINMWFVQRIWEDGFFKYDPTNYHGPLHFYLIQLLQLWMGFDYLSTRWVAAIFSFLTLVVLWFGPLQQRAALRWSAAFLLMSPAMGFYGRSGIHEAGFVFFQVLGLMSFHYLVARDFKKFWWTFMAGLLGMMALKETFVILILSLMPAFALVALTERKTLRYRLWAREMAQSFKSREVWLPVLGMFLLFLGVFSGFGAHPRGITDFFVALMPWLKTGVHGAGHEKEFLTWGLMMVRYEFAILAGCALGLVFIVKNKWLRFYLVFAVVLWGIYSAIPYKTPWCLISILWPFGVVAGFAVQDAVSWLQGWKKLIVILPVLGLFGGESVKMYQTMYRDPIDMNHPYVYVNSTYQMKEFVAKTQKLVKENPTLRDKIVQIGTEESWPVPIVFYKFHTLSYFRTDVKVEEDALIYMVDAKDQGAMEASLKAREKMAAYEVFTLDVRQGRTPILIYAQKAYFHGLFSWPMKDVEAL